MADAAADTKRDGVVDRYGSNWLSGHVVYSTASQIDYATLGVRGGMAEEAILMQEAKALQDAIDSHTKSIMVSRSGICCCCSHLT